MKTKLILILFFVIGLGLAYTIPQTVHNAKVTINMMAVTNNNEVNEVNIIASGEGILTGKTGTYTLMGNYNLNVTDVSVEWEGSIPAWGNLIFDYDMKRGFEDKLVRDGNFLSGINNYTDIGTLWHYTSGSSSIAIVNVGDDPSNDSYCANITFYGSESLSAYLGNYISAPYIGGAGYMRNIPINVTATLENSSSIKLYPPAEWYYLRFPAYLNYINISKVTLSVTFNITPIGTVNVTLGYTLFDTIETQLFSIKNDSTIEFYLPPIYKFFNFTKIGRWIHIDIELLQLYAYLQNKTIEEVKTEVLNAISVIGIGYVGHLWLTIEDWDKNGYNENYIYLDEFYGEITGTLSLKQRLPFLITEYGVLFYGLWINDKIYDGGLTAGKDSVSLNFTTSILQSVVSILKQVFEDTYGIKIREITIQYPNDLDDKMLRHSLLYFALQNDYTIKVGYHFTSNISQIFLKKSLYYYYTDFEVKNDFLTKITEIEANGCDAIITVDGSKSIIQIIENIARINTKLDYIHKINIRIYPLVQVSLEILDSRGKDVPGALVMTNLDTGREYQIVTSSPVVTNISSGVYEVTAKVLLYEEKVRAGVTIHGGVINIQLSKDFREITGEAMRVFLAYIPIAVVIPIAFMFSSIPLLVKKRGV